MITALISLMEEGGMERWRFRVIMVEDQVHKFLQPMITEVLILMFLASFYVQQTQVAKHNNNTDMNSKKAGKKTMGSSSKIWCFNDPELQRKRRVASYKVYSVEGKMKGSFTKSYRWLKDRYTKVVYGWW